MIKKYAVLWFCFLLAVPVIAQDTAPEEPDIVLPPRLLEVDDPAVEEIQVFIPSDGDVDVSPMAVQLPEPEDITLLRGAFDLLLPGDSSGGQSSGPGSSDFFSETTLGLGTPSVFIGDISLFMLGREPRARLRFHHEGRDGFGEHASGTGFHARKEIFEGDLAVSPENLEADINGVITDEEFGLQGRSTGYSSLLYRSLSGTVDLEAPLSDRITAGGIGRVSLSDTVLAGTVPLRGTELDTEVTMNVSMNTRYIRFDAVGGYRFLDWFGTVPPVHLLQAGISIESLFPFALDLRGDAGIRWIPGESPVFPFSLTATAYLGGVASLYLSGGYEWDLVSFSHLRERFPLVDYRDSAGIEISQEEESCWFVESEIRYEPSERLGLSLGGSWMLADSHFQPGTLSERGLVSPLWLSVDSLRLTAGLSWHISDAVFFEFNTGGRVYGSDGALPVYDFSGILEFSGPEGRYGASAGADYGIWEGHSTPGSSPPLVNLGSFFKISEGVSLLLDAEDILSVFSSTPGYTWGGYERPGFALVFKTQLSL